MAGGGARDRRRRDRPGARRRRGGAARAGRGPTYGTGSSTSGCPGPTRSRAPPPSAWCRCRRAGSSARSATGCSRALGPERAGWAYRYRSLLDAGIVAPGSSDRPVVDGAPLLGMHDMVNRRTDGGQPCGPEEAISGLEALTAYTLGSAYASHAERDRGTIAVGQVRRPRRALRRPRDRRPDGRSGTSRCCRRCWPERWCGSDDPGRGRRRSPLRSADAVRAIYEDAFPEELRAPFDDLVRRPDAGAARRRRTGGLRPGARPRPRRTWTFLRYYAVGRRGRGTGSPMWAELTAPAGRDGRTRLVWDVEDPDEAGPLPRAGRGAPAPDRLLRAARRPAASRCATTCRRTTTGTLPGCC